MWLAIVLALLVGCAQAESIEGDDRFFGDRALDSSFARWLLTAGWEVPSNELSALTLERYNVPSSAFDTLPSRVKQEWDGHAEVITWVYTPPATANGRVPVIFFLHGFCASESEAYGAARAISRGFHSRVLEGLLPPALLVFPQGLTFLDDSPLWTDSLMGETGESYGLGQKGPWTTFFLDELIPFIDTNFHTLATKQHRALLGYSAGATGVIAVGSDPRSEDLIGHIAALSGVYDLKSLLPSTDPDDTKMLQSLFAEACFSELIKNEEGSSSPFSCRERPFVWTAERPLRAFLRSVTSEFTYETPGFPSRVDPVCIPVDAEGVIDTAKVTYLDSRMPADTFISRPHTKKFRLWLDIGKEDVFFASTTRLHNALLAQGWFPGDKYHYEAYEGSHFNRIALRMPDVFDWLFEGFSQCIDSSGGVEVDGATFEAGNVELYHNPASQELALRFVEKEGWVFVDVDAFVGNDVRDLLDEDHHPDPTRFTHHLDYTEQQELRFKLTDLANITVIVARVSLHHADSGAVLTAWVRFDANQQDIIETAAMGPGWYQTFGLQHCPGIGTIRHDGTTSSTPPDESGDGAEGGSKGPELLVVVIGGAAIALILVGILLGVFVVRQRRRREGPTHTTASVELPLKPPTVPSAVPPLALDNAVGFRSIIASSPGQIVSRWKNDRTERTECTVRTPRPEPADLEAGEGSSAPREPLITSGASMPDLRIQAQPTPDPHPAPQPATTNSPPPPRVLTRSTTAPPRALVKNVRAMRDGAKPKPRGPSFPTTTKTSVVHSAARRKEVHRVVSPATRPAAPGNGEKRHTSSPAHRVTTQVVSQDGVEFE